MNLGERITAFFSSFRILAPYLFSSDPKYRESTEEYPDFVSSRLRAGAFSAGRGFLRNDLQVCTGCGDCETICPSKAISMDSKVSDDGTTKVSKFEINFAKCVFCGVCVDICPVDSIIHTSDYEMAVSNKDDMRGFFTERDRNFLTKSENIRKKVKQIRSYEVRR